MAEILDPLTAEMLEFKRCKQIPLLLLEDYYAFHVPVFKE